ncbi:Ras-association [Penicillium paradoxum]|uniref:Ras-association n=1 Tax=Penicillium paradoxum TaxID=176176 RepID=UPI0025498CDE|nr:Ras-association [Penicillium paradoxum]KAJ5773372.1 Ras-association [Penicillium paradoxum]
MPVRDRKQPDNRQGSASSGNSWLSQDTVRNAERQSLDQDKASVRGPSADSFSDSFKMDSKQETSKPPRIDWGNSMWSWNSPDISPTEQRKASGFSNHREALIIPNNRDSLSQSSLSNPRPPSLNPSRLDPDEIESIAPWSTAPSSGQPDTSGTFYHEFSEHEASPASATFRPTTGRTFASEPAEFEYHGEHRRPSAASATTVSSQGSRSSISQKLRKKHLKGLLGDDYHSPGELQTDDDGSQNPPSRRGGPVDQLKARERANSDGSRNTPEGSNSSQRSHRQRSNNPLPSSDITPWDYQSFNDIPQYGEAPVRHVPIGPDGQRLASENGTSGQKEPSRRAGRHRPSRSKEENPTVAGDLAWSQPRPATGRDDISLRPFNENYLHSTTDMSDPNLYGGRSTSPTPSVRSAYRDHDGNSQHPRIGGFIKKILGHGSKSHDRSRNSSPPRRDRQGSLEGSTSSRYPESIDSDRKKDSGKGLIVGRKLGPRRVFINQGGDLYTPNKEDKTQEENKHFFHLDVDMENLKGIVRPPSPGQMRRAKDGTVTPGDDSKMEKPWNAPESWQVRGPVDPTLEEPTTVGPREREASFFIRIFRIDSTFATLSAGVNATVSEILLMLGRKSFLQDHLNNYEIVLRKNDLSRQLDHNERPIQMQKKLLEQVGYTDKDRIGDIGREDHSYLCRFIFLPTKLSGYSSLESDPGFNKVQKFSHVDLQGRSLVTIPITLYAKSSEIISLNLSRNLSLDVPKDFIQSCINLREIKFIGNEASYLPQSFGLAGRLTYLDVSNNCLEDLDHAGLDRLTGLVSIKMANNQLTKLPSSFGNFQTLRSLNMSSNGFKVFPDFLCNLKSLVDLDISFNGIEELPNIGRLTTLERLWITNNNLSGPLDDSFGKLVNLKEFDGRFNAITNIDALSSLPRLEQIFFGHNLLSRFKGSFPKLRSLHLDHCPLTQFDIDTPMPTLTSLNLASGKLSQFKDSIFENCPNMTKLVLDKNHISSVSPQIGKLRRLEHFSMIKNPLSSLPPTLGCLGELKFLNLRECNLTSLPAEIWHCAKLEVLNISSNILSTFPKCGAPFPQIPGEPTNTPVNTPGIAGNTSYEDIGPLDEALRRPSQTSNGIVNTVSPNGVYRNPSTAQSVSQQGARKVSAASRSVTDPNSVSRKDSNFSQQMAMTFAASLRTLSLADNRLEDDVFRELSLLPELRIVNLSYNDLTELPQGILKRWPLISELYLSGNELTSLPSDDLEEGSNLKILHINANRFQVLPAELCKVSKLSILDVGSNGLKYNVSNWPYDWNWNWNRNLKYLNFSGNKRLEIKPNIASLGPPAANGADLTDFNSLTHLRVLGLMDVTLTIPTIPEETEDRRVRTSASLAGTLAYGMADSLGKTEHLSIIDMIVPRLKQDNVETLVGMFDGQTLSSGGSRVAKFLHENFTSTFSFELKRLQRDQGETPLDAMRRTFLALNKNMAGSAYRSIDDREVRQYHRGSAAAKMLNQDDIQSGGVATVLYLNNMDLYSANVGDAQAILIRSDGSMISLTQNHDPAEPSERARIRAAGGFVSRNGKLNDVLTVSRCFGHFPMMPAVIAAPSTMHTTLTEQDEMIVLASKELWDYVTPEVVVDITRREQPDLMFAAQKLRDLAISFGATNKLMVMILGVGEIQKRRPKPRPSLNTSSSTFAEEQIIPTAKRPKKRDGPGDSRLARFEFVDAPDGELTIMFTDIKQSTALWELCPDAMRSAIQIHNDILRRQLGIFGGYEVKTEGDAFMVAFSTTTAALLWCFNCQNQLLEAEWPTEILDQPQCRVVVDMDNNVIFRGLSVRMGGHWGEPVCAKDPVTNRMDYFGPMVNRASRISAVADGGQIFVSSDFMADIQRNLEIFADAERSASTSSTDTNTRVDSLGHNIRRELQQLNSQGFVIKDQGERKLKGLENPEPLYLVYSSSLSGRMISSEESQDGDSSAATISPNNQLDIQTNIIWRLWEVTIRLERICGALEQPSDPSLREPNVALFNMVKRHGGELNDSTVISLIDQQVTRVEVCINTLSLRHMMRPFKPGDNLKDHAVPIGEVLQQLQTQLAEFQALKQQMAVGAAGNISGLPSYGNMGPSDSIDSGITSASSSFLHLPGDTNRSFDSGRGRP